MKPRFKFEAIPWDDRWFPCGLAANGDDVFVDGCVIADKKLAERIAMNMEAAYNQGVEDASLEFVQHAIRVTRAHGLGDISDTACGNGVVVYEKKEKPDAEDDED